MSDNGTEKFWTGDEWERYVQTLLRRKYGPAYQEVPDVHCGDFGIEGFSSTDATAYQCYATEGLVDAETLYQRQRDKVTADLGKFSQNREELGRLFGDLKIARWVLVVPYHTSAKLVQHAAKKSAEIRALALPYVAPSFEVSIATDATFSVERATLANAGIASITVAMPEIPDSEFDQWCEDNSSLLARMGKKLKHIPTLANARKRRDTMKHFTKGYLRGQAALASLREEYPEVYERVVAAKEARERILEIESAVGGTAPQKALKEELASLEASFISAAPTLSRPMASHLVIEAVTDWLIRCPLDFSPEDS